MFDNDKDSLTGAYSRRGADLRLEAALERANAQPCFVAVTFVDIDGFKTINDTFGHMFGDQVLRETALVLKEAFSEGSSVCRFGGDEFLIISTDIPKSSLIEWAERARHRAKRIPIRLDDGSYVPFSLTIGMSFYPRHGSTREDLLRAADQAMYRGKGMGGDRILWE
jgi:diguanylate cyclase (GGDEF)-like protein